ncbi:MAG: SRPBCC family protein [Thermoleophilaceae bacterium]
MSPTDTGLLRLERTFDASPEAVFDAWTNPDVLLRWWAAAPSWRPASAEVDLRVGGRYRLAMGDPESGALHAVGGEYREVSRPDRIVYSWSWEEGDGHESVVTVTFRPEGDRTTVVLEHGGLASAESAERHRHGWEGCLDSLAAARVLGG